jgi:hypothetical protein
MLSRPIDPEQAANYEERFETIDVKARLAVVPQTDAELAVEHHGFRRTALTVQELAGEMIKPFYYRYERVEIQPSRYDDFYIKVHPTQSTSVEQYRQRLKAQLGLSIRSTIRIRPLLLARAGCEDEANDFVETLFKRHGNVIMFGQPVPDFSDWVQSVDE